MNALGEKVAAKRAVSVTVKMEASDWEEFQQCASLKWPGAIMSKSSLVLSLAKLGVEACHKEEHHPHKVK